MLDDINPTLVLLGEKKEKIKISNVKAFIVQYNGLIILWEIVNT